jgi:hypothetical protein
VVSSNQVVRFLRSILIWWVAFADSFFPSMFNSAATGTVEGAMACVCMPWDEWDDHFAAQLVDSDDFKMPGHTPA